MILQNNCNYILTNVVFTFITFSVYFNGNNVIKVTVSLTMLFSISEGYKLVIHADMFKLNLLIFYKKMNFFGGSSRGVQLCIYPWLKTGPPLLRMVIVFDQACSFGRDVLGGVREEGATCLARQINWINPDDQWGDRCCSQITLTFQVSSLTTMVWK